MMTVRSSFSRVTASTFTIAALGVLGAGCGTSPAEESTGTARSDLVRPVAYSYSATTLAAPFTGCAAPQLRTETMLLSGATLLSFIAACPDNATATAWVTAHPTWSASLEASSPFGSSVITPPAGDVYVLFMPEAPTTMPSESGTPPVAYNTDTPPVAFKYSNYPVDDASPVPCTDMFFSYPAQTPTYNGIRYNKYSWVAYCVQTPAVDALAAQLAATNFNDPTTGTYHIFGESPTAGPSDMPVAAYGYVYLYGAEDKSHGPIGGGCSSGCFWQ